MSACVFLELAFPLLAQFTSALPDASMEVVIHSVGNQELGVLRPSVGALGELDFLFTQGLAVRRGRVLPVGRTVSDVAGNYDQRGPILGRLGRPESAFDSREVVGIADAQHIPAVGGKARAHVFGEGNAGRAFDGDVVVVVNPAEIVQLQVAGERSGLAGDAFHHAAVSAQAVNGVVKDVEARAVVAGGQPLARDRHADAGSHALAERAGGRFHAGGPAIFRMAGGPAAELAEVPYVVQRHAGPAEDFVIRIDRLGTRQVEDRIQQHGSMAGGEHKAVAVGPDRVFGIEAQHPLPQCVDGGRHAHGRAGMTVGFLDGINRQRADGVDAQLVNVDGSDCNICHTSPTKNGGGRLGRTE